LAVTFNDSLTKIILIWPSLARGSSLFAMTISHHSAQIIFPVQIVFPVQMIFPFSLFRTIFRPPSLAPLLFSVCGFVGGAQVGGGPTGVESAAEIHDMVIEDMLPYFPKLKVPPFFPC
jgi:hypothetical protein